ncbi:MAG: PPC domain-containing protein, partial [Cyanobacteria bacterium J06614_10]
TSIARPVIKDGFAQITGNVFEGDYRIRVYGSELDLRTQVFAYTLRISGERAEGLQPPDPGSIDSSTATEPSEANNTAETASILSVGIGTTEVSGTINNRFDKRDFYEFVAPVDGWVTASSSLPSPHDLRYFSQSGDTSGIISSSYNNQLSFAVEAGETYFVSVFGAQSGSQVTYDYDLDLTLDSDPVREAGETFETAYRLAFNRNLSDAHTDTHYEAERVGEAGDPVDIYRFTLDGPTPLRLQLSELTADADLTLFDAAGNTLAVSNRAGTAAELIEMESLAAGEYYVSVTSYDGVATDYVLVTTNISNQDDSPRTASILSVGIGTTEVSGTINSRFDRDDYYQFVAPVDGWVTASSSVPSAHSLRYFSQGGDASGAINSVYNNQLSFAVEAGETYFVSLTGTQSGSQVTFDYDLDLTLDSDPVREAGETFETAYRLAFNRNLSDAHTDTHYEAERVGEAGDPVDIYRFTLDGPTPLRLQLSELTADADLTLFDAAGIVIAQSYQDGTESEEITIETLGPGEYYIEVTSFNTIATEYMLVVTNAETAATQTVENAEDKVRELTGDASNNVLFGTQYVDLIDAGAGEDIVFG